MSTLTVPRQAAVARASAHRPLLWLSVAMAVLTVVCLLGFVADPRIITGAPAWEKPLKFSLSVLIYGLTLSLLLGQLQRWRRFAWWAGTISAVFLAVEMIIIVGAAMAGTTSHFNVSTPFAAALWSVMAASISIVWVVTVVVAILLFRADLGDRARSFAIRAGVVLAIVGMALAFLMTGPQPDQISNFQGIIGAHAVGIADGGPGLPLLGWSTVAGDLRIPHFVGMHAMQVIPLAAFALELWGRRLPALARPGTRLGILWVLVGLYAALLAVFTVQALAGESIVRPDAAIATVSIALLALAAAGITAIVAASTRRARSPRA